MIVAIWNEIGNIIFTDYFFYWKCGLVLSENRTIKRENSKNINFCCLIWDVNNNNLCNKSHLKKKIKFEQKIN